MSQTAPSYKLNTANAKAAGVSGRIDEKGAYRGTITRAEAVVSSRGTMGIEIAFRTEAGQTADYLSLWTTNPDGKELPGRKVVDALMTCVQARTLTPQSATVKKWDRNSQQEVMVQAVVYPELMGKPVGLLLVREEYEKTNGGTGWKMALVGAFEAQRGLMPKEVLENTGPGLLLKVADQLRDRPLQKRVAGNGPRPTGGAGGAAGGGSGFDDMDDDIPF